MRRLILILILSGLAGAGAVAQIINPPSLSVDLSNVATKAELTAVQAAMPVAGTQISPSEVVGGSVTGAGVYAPIMHSHPRITRAGSCTTGAAGTCTITWGTPLTVAPNVVLEPINSGSQPVECNSTSAPTTTSVSIKCWTAQSVTVSLLGAVVAPFVTTPSGITVQATAIPPTQ